MASEPDLVQEVLDVEYVESENLKVPDPGTTYSLKTFLIGNDKLISTLSLFTALTVFANRFVHPPTAGRLLPFVLLLTSFVLFHELRSHFPYGLAFSLRRRALEARFIFHSENPANRLGLFSILLDATIVSLAIVTAWDYKYFVLALTATLIVVFFLFRVGILLRRAFAQIPIIAQMIVKMSKDTFLIQLMTGLVVAVFGVAASAGIEFFISQFADAPDGLISSFRNVSWLLVIASVLQLFLGIALSTAIVKRLRNRLQQRVEEERRLRKLYADLGLWEYVAESTSGEDMTKIHEFQQSILREVAEIQDRQKRRRSTKRFRR